MKKTNQTYAVYIAHEDTTKTIRGKKDEMRELFEKVKYDYNYVAFNKWNSRYNCWDTIITSRNE